MSRKDNSPIPQTCPLIDEVLSLVETVYMSEGPMSKGEYKDIEVIMEKIRNANSDLRDWGNEQYNRAEEMEKDLDWANGKIKELSNDIESAKLEMKEIQKELDQLT